MEVIIKNKILDLIDLRHDLIHFTPETPLINALREHVGRQIRLLKEKLIKLMANYEFLPRRTHALIDELLKVKKIDIALSLPRLEKWRPIPRDGWYDRTFTGKDWYNKNVMETYSKASKGYFGPIPETYPIEKIRSFMNVVWDDLLIQHNDQVMFEFQKSDVQLQLFFFFLNLTLSGYGDDYGLQVASSNPPQLKDEEVFRILTILTTQTGTTTTADVST